MACMIQSRNSFNPMCALLLIFQVIVIPQEASAEALQNSVIVEFSERPDSICLDNGAIYTGNSTTDSLLNENSIRGYELLWKEETPENTFLSRCLLVVYTDTLRAGEQDSLLQSLSSQNEVDRASKDCLAVLHTGNEWAPDEEHFADQWYMLNEITGKESNDIDWVRAYHYTLSDTAFSSSATVAFIDVCGAMKVSFYAGDNSVRVLHDDIYWENIFFNAAEDNYPYGVFTTADSVLIDSDNNGLPDDVVGWDFITAPDGFRVLTPPPPPEINCTLWGNDEGDGVYFWENHETYDHLGDPWPNVASHNHGDHIAGIIAAKVNDDFGIAGIGGYTDSLKLLQVRAGMTRSIIVSRAMVALEYLRRMNVDVINLSWGVEADTISAAPGLRNELVKCYNDGIVIVASSANKGDPPDNYDSHFPAIEYSTLSIAGTTSADVKNSTSCWQVVSPNRGVDLAAPGADIYTIRTDFNLGAYDTPCVYLHKYETSFGGTSAAAPMVAAAAALLIAKDPINFRGSSGEYVERVRNRLKKSAQVIDPNADWNETSKISPKLGAGRLNLFYALFYNESDSSSVTMSSHQENTTIVTCPGDTLDDMTLRMHIKNEFGEYVTSHVDTLAKAISFDVESGYLTTKTTIDNDLLDNLEDVLFPGTDDFVYLETVSAGPGYLDVVIEDPIGCGTVKVYGHIIDAQTDRALVANDHYWGKSMYDSKFEGPEIIFTIVDLDDDGDVDSDDQTVFMTHFNSEKGNPNYSCCVDYDNDEDVDLADFAVFASHKGQ